MNYSINKIAQIINAKIIGDNSGQTVQSIAFDSRKITQTREVVFIALKGKRQNGHHFIQNAYEKSIRIFIVEEISNPLPNAVFLRVENTLHALQKLAKHHRELFDLPIIGITGSNGKTVVKEWLNQILYRDFTIARSPKSYNSQIGIPLSLLQLLDSHNLGIIEAGISEIDEMEFLEKMIQPKIGIFTNIGSAHSQGFPNKKFHIQEKLKLFTNSEILIYPDSDNDLHDEITEFCITNQIKKLSFGTRSSSDIFIDSINTVNNKTEIHASYQNQDYHYFIPFIDSASAQNSLHIFTVLTALNLQPQEKLTSFESLQSVEMRLELKQAIYNSILINDSYNSDLQSVKIALELLSQQIKPKKHLIITDLHDLNASPSDLYSNLANEVNQFEIDSIVIIGNEITQFEKLFSTQVFSYQSTSAFLKDLPQYKMENSAILLKGARVFELERVAQQLENQTHDTVLEIDLDALIHNLHIFKNLINRKTKVMAMVKAFSYGTGDYEIARTLELQNVDYFGVAYADEGVELRKSGIQTPILVMNPEQSSYDTIIRNDLEPEIYSFRVLSLFLQSLSRYSFSHDYPIHIKIDSGMNRLGFKKEELDKLLIDIEKSPVRIASVFSHLATSDDEINRDFTLHQIQVFDSCYLHLVKSLAYHPIKHILNSSGIINFPEHQNDMVRLGIGLYGYSSNNSLQQELRNLVRFKTVISQITTLQKGESVSYGRTFIADKEIQKATLPVGYADGMRKDLSNGIGHVIIHNQKAKILGAICMDMMMVDVSEIVCQEGDEVILLGKELSILERARQLDTIPYEVLTSISKRVKRIYLKE